MVDISRYTKVSHFSFSQFTVMGTLSKWYDLQRIARIREEMNLLTLNTFEIE